MSYPYPFIQFGTSTVDNPFGITTDSNGNIYATGYINGNNLGINPTSGDVFIGKYNTDGTQANFIQLVTAGAEVASSISIGSNNNVYVSGYTSGTLPGNTNLGATDAFIVKYNTDGTQAWVKQFGTTANDSTSGIKTDSSGNVYATGATFGSLPGNTNLGSINITSDAFIVKYNTDGTQAWVKQFGSNALDSGSGISIDSSGNVYATGVTTGALPGYTHQGTGFTNNDSFIVKYDPTNGNQLWARQFGTTGDDRATSISTDSSGNVYVTGATTGALVGSNFGSQDAFIVKYDTSGNQLAVKQFGTSGNDRATSISTDSNGNFYVSGYTDGAFSGTNQGSNDAFIVKYNANGTQAWVKQFGTAVDDRATSITIGSNGNIYVSGTTAGALSGTNQGNYDAFIAALDANGNFFAAPTVAKSIADYTIPTSTTLNYTFAANTFSDVNVNDTLTYTATLADDSSLPSWLTFNATTRTFSNISTTISGNYTLKVTANDGNGGIVSNNFNLNIQAPTTGTPNSDTFTSTSSSDVFYGLAGNDYLLGSLGADYFDGGDGLDIIDYKNSTSGVTIDLATGTGSGGDAQGDTLISIEQVMGSAFADTITGNSTDHSLYGGGGNDILRAGTGKGYLRGNEGNDTLYGGSNNDRLLGDEGDDLLYGGAGNDILKGWIGNDTLFGDAGNDTFYGDDGIDVLTGANVATLGVGENDSFYGGSDSDTFVLGNNSNAFYNDGDPSTLGLTDYARIYDFNKNEDKVQLYSGLTYHLGAAPLGALSGTGLFIDNDGAAGLTPKDELIASFVSTSLTYGQVTNPTTGFNFV